MKKILFLCSCLLIFFACTDNTEYLPKDNWFPENHKVLNKLISVERNNPNAYAVFDFDNTTIINDIELCLMSYQIQELKFKIKKEDFKKALCNGLKDANQSFRIADKEVSFKDLAEDLSKDYNFLYDHYIQAQIQANSQLSREKTKSNKLSAKKNRRHKSLKHKKQFSKEEIMQSPEFQDFRAKLWAFSYGTYVKCDYAYSCIWLINLLKGMNKTDILELSKAAGEYNLRIPPHNITWQSPKMGKCGSISVELPVGLALTKSMKDLYKALKDNKIERYICTASFQLIVQGLLCSKNFNLDIDTSKVIGLRAEFNPDGSIADRLDSNYIATYEAGKTAAIKKYIAPKFANHSPILVAGDSMGDFDMLNAFPDLKVALLINCNRSKPFSDLYAKALEQNKAGDLLLKSATRYLVQGRNPAKGEFIQNTSSVAFK